MKKIKVWMGVCPQYGASIGNVAIKYHEYAPEDLIEWVDDWMDADVLIDHLIGTPDRKNLVHPLERSFSEEVKIRLEMAEMGLKKVAYVMHCSIVPDHFYLTALNESIVSTGFLDIDSILASEIGLDEDWNAHLLNLKDKWLRVSWGVEPSDFLLPMRKGESEYTIYTWGASADPEEECIRTIYEAVKEIGGKMLHSGADYKFDDGKHYKYLPPAKTPQEVAQRYNMCRFANAMRFEDGFELANIEAPLSNAVPICLGTQIYRDHFEGPMIGKCVQFVDPKNVKEDLVKIFKTDKKVKQTDKNRIIDHFKWENAVKPFWERIVKSFE